MKIETVSKIVNRFRLIVSDMDGTLLTSRNELPTGFFETIRQLNAAGIRFAAASGRQYYNLLKRFEPVQDTTLFLAENGAMVFCGREKLFTQCCDGAFFEPMIDFIRESLPGSYPILCGEKAAYIENTDPDFQYHAGLYFERLEQVDDLKSVFTDDVFCKVAVFNTDAEANALPHLQTFAPEFRVTLSGPTWVDMMIPGVNKGQALARLLKQLAIPPAECIVFGDYLNDLEMMQIGALGVAMENAHPDLKKAADLVAPSNDNDGVRVMLRRLDILKD